MTATTPDQHDRLSRPEATAIARLHALLEILPAGLDRCMADDGITSFEYLLLDALDASEGGRMRLSALASKTNATLSRLSRVVTSLERKQLVVRAACPEDGRATNAVITKAGIACIERARPHYARAVHDLVLEGFTARDVDDLARLSLKILSHLDPDGAGRAPAPSACAADPAPRGAATDTPRE